METIEHHQNTLNATNAFDDHRKAQSIAWLKVLELQTLQYFLDMHPEIIALREANQRQFADYDRSPFDVIKKMNESLNELFFKNKTT